MAQRLPALAAPGHIGGPSTDASRKQRVGFGCRNAWEGRMGGTGGWDAGIGDGDRHRPSTRAVVLWYALQHVLRRHFSLLGTVVRRRASHTLLVLGGGCGKEAVWGCNWGKLIIGFFMLSRVAMVLRSRRYSPLDVELVSLPHAGGFMWHRARPASGYQPENWARIHV